MGEEAGGFARAHRATQSDDARVEIHGGDEEIEVERDGLEEQSLNGDELGLDMLEHELGLLGRELLDERVGRVHDLDQFLESVVELVGEKEGGDGEVMVRDGGVQGGVEVEEGLCGRAAE